MKSNNNNKPDIDKKIDELEGFINGIFQTTKTEGTLMSILHKTQQTFGYIPSCAMDFISYKTNIPTAHIYGMATFYNHFSLKQKAKNKISLCKGTACYVAGGTKILKKLKEELQIDVGDITKDGLFSMDITRCLGCCGLSPVMQINEDIYVRMTPEKIPGIIKKYKKEGKNHEKKDSSHR